MDKLFSTIGKKLKKNKSKDSETEKLQQQLE
jgi:hypothetical protein